MKFRILSDLHIEFSKYEVPTQQDDINTVLILAGDVGLFKQHIAYIDFVEDCSVKFRHVVVIPGNHEFYGTNIGNGARKVLAGIANITNVSILNCDTIIIDDVAIIGATLWTDFNRSDIIRYDAQTQLTDFKKIRYGTDSQPWLRKFNTTDALGLHWQHKSFIELEIQKHKANNLKTVVVTHHGCSAQSIDHVYIGDDLNYAYISDQATLIEEHAPTLWVHGHVHQNFDYTIGTTRVVCNPRGYPKYSGDGFENINFQDFFYVEV